MKTHTAPELFPRFAVLQPHQIHFFLQIISFVKVQRNLLVEQRAGARKGKIGEMSSKKREKGRKIQIAFFSLTKDGVLPRQCVTPFSHIQCLYTSPKEEISKLLTQNLPVILYPRYQIPYYAPYVNKHEKCICKHVHIRKDLSFCNLNLKKKLCFC